MSEPTGMDQGVALLERAHYENWCDDAGCIHRRLTAALAVLAGGSTHVALAQVVEWAQLKRPVLPTASLPVELLSAIREDFAALPPDNRLREGGLMLVEAVVSLSAAARPPEVDAGGEGYRGITNYPTPGDNDRPAATEDERAKAAATPTQPSAGLRAAAQAMLDAEEERVRAAASGDSLRNLTSATRLAEAIKAVRAALAAKPDAGEGIAIEWGGPDHVHNLSHSERWGPGDQDWGDGCKATITIEGHTVRVVVHSLAALRATTDETGGGET